MFALGLFVVVVVVVVVAAAVVVVSTLNGWLSMHVRSGFCFSV